MAPEQRLTQRSALKLVKAPADETTRAITAVNAGCGRRSSRTNSLGHRAGRHEIQGGHRTSRARSSASCCGRSSATSANAFVSGRSSVRDSSWSMPMVLSSRPTGVTLYTA